MKESTMSEKMIYAELKLTFASPLHAAILLDALQSLENRLEAAGAIRSLRAVRDLKEQADNEIVPVN